jgi:hypothetical protein
METPPPQISPLFNINLKLFSSSSYSSARVLLKTIIIYTLFFVAKDEEEEEEQAAVAEKFKRGQSQIAPDFRNNLRSVR